MSDPENVVAEDDEIEIEVGVDNECTSEASEIIVPTVGMKFKDHNEIFEFYKTYVYSVGFPVRKRSSRKDDDGLLKYVTFSCSQEGRRTGDTSNSLRPQPTIQTRCFARLTATTDLNGAWRVNKVILEHNHPTSPSKSRLYRCNRQLTEKVKRKLEVNDIAGIPMHKSYNSAVVEAGGYENLPFIEKDCRNYIDQIRRLRLGEGDIAAIQAYFTKMQAQCPGFFSSLDLDDDCRLKNVFWADNRCRQAYKEFGDVITFNTTYLTNKYDMPFAPFIGVNHHGQSTLFGYLLQNEIKNLTISRLITSYGSNPLSQGSVQIASDCPEGARTSSGPILDPHCTITKGAPRKLRKKGILETMSKKRKDVVDHLTGIHCQLCGKPGQLSGRTCILADFIADEARQIIGGADFISQNAG
ncbi:protein FAR1-RELATED SEQUENCE 5-like [Diospyros lotus]|uniref:protein FAR1-RELATED SEQUENCE 5-like n=1 Tax=Diospyros lotus TaxID=55363 RepID=UPI002259FB34|nr:protein FAR1-RELATED SEQUENCE 5-like [Diospyros lotus]